MLGRIFKVLSVVFLLLVWNGAASAASVDYFGYEEFGGTWCDAEKSPSNTEDDMMCWAAAASNMLVWTGWSSPVSENTDDIFAYYQDHWTDEGGMMQYGWDWWFDGMNPSQGWSDWSHVDVPGGGFWDPPYDFNDYYHKTSQNSLAASAIADYLHAGYGVTLGIYGSGGHAISCWGYKYDEDTGDLLGVWVSDSDNSKYQENPSDLLLYFDLEESGGRWYLQNFYGSSAWYIGEVQALDRAPIPEPASILMMFVGGMGVAGAIRRRKK